MRPSDSRLGRDGLIPHRAANFADHDGSPRFLGFSFPARCLQSPREACQLHTSVASLAVAGFVQSGGLTASTLCNEAEASSISLRLTGSPHRASPWGLLLSVPGWLHVGHLFDMMITFQITRKARLGLAHRNTRMKTHTVTWKSIAGSAMNAQQGRKATVHSFLSVYSAQSVVKNY